MLAPITGPAGSIGSDQLHWAQFYVTQWNKTRTREAEARPGRHAARPVEGLDGRAVVRLERLDHGRDRTGRQRRGSGCCSDPEEGGLAFASGSATRVSLTNGSWKGFFFRDVPNDGVQGPTAGNYMFSKLGLKSGDSVMVVDDQESYSTGLADIVGQNLSGKGVKVDRESISQKATDFSSLVAKVTSATKVVYLPFQLASEAQLFAQQLRRRARTRSCSAATEPSTRRSST